MSNDTKATPRPWKTDPIRNDTCRQIVTREDGWVVAEVYSCSLDRVPKGSTEQAERNLLEAASKANAALIVRAVNSHAALVEACALVLSNGYRPADLGQDDGDKMIGEKLRAALALAGEVQQ